MTSLNDSSTVAASGLNASAWLTTATSAHEQNFRVYPVVVRDLYLLIGVLGALGNGVAICVIATSASMRKTFTNVLIMNQSLIDLFASIFVLIMVTLPKLDQDLYGTRGWLYCYVWLSDLPFWAAMTSSSYCLVAISIERYVAIVWPIFHRTQLKHYHVIAMALAAQLSGPVLEIIFLLQSSEMKDGFCYDWVTFNSDTSKKIFGILSCTYAFFIPIAIILGCYVGIYYSLIARSPKVSAQVSKTDSAMEARKAKNLRNVVMALATVVFCYIVCNTIKSIEYLRYNLGANLDFMSAYYQFISVLQLSNCCVNPFVYTFQYSAYKKQAKRLFLCRKETSDSSSVSSTAS